MTTETDDHHDHTGGPTEPTTGPLLNAWTAAETVGDIAALETLLHPDFRGVGPHGFVLDLSQWLARFEQPFEVTTLTLQDIDVMNLDPPGTRLRVIFVNALQHQVASYRGHRSDDRFRLGLVISADGDQLRVVQAQLSGPLPATS